MADGYIPQGLLECLADKGLLHQYWANFEGCQTPENQRVWVWVEGLEAMSDCSGFWKEVLPNSLSHQAPNRCYPHIATAKNSPAKYEISNAHIMESLREPRNHNRWKWLEESANHIKASNARAPRITGSLIEAYENRYSLFPRSTAD